MDDQGLTGELRVLSLHAHEDGASHLYRLQQGVILEFRLGASLLGCDIELFTNYPLDGSPYEREKFHPLVWAYEGSNTKDDTAAFVRIKIAASGSYKYYFTCASEDVGGQGFFLVDPILKAGPNDEVLNIDCLQCQTVLAKNLGHISTWESKLEVAKASGFNVIHFTPVQTLGGSNSGYSLEDQHGLNVTFQATWSDIENVVSKMRKEWGILSICDIVLNHTANETKWIYEKSEASYNCLNSPHLRPAFLFDRVLYHLSKDIEAGLWTSKGIPKAEVSTQSHLDAARALIYDEYFPKVKIYEFFMLDVANVLDEFEKKILSSDPPSEEANHGLSLEDIVLIQDPEFCRLKCSIDFDVALKIFNVKHNHCQKEEDRILHCCSELKKRLDQLNHEAYNKAWEHLNSGVDNVFKGAHYHRVAEDGPKEIECSGRNPLVCQYFTAGDDTLEEEESMMYDNRGAKFMAHNGWVMGHDPLINFALPGSLVYLRRELVAWGDSIKLRFGEKPEDCPWLWNYMKEYTEQTARVFDGIRLDNCHSTPIHVAEYMLDAARRVRPNLYVIAELFTSSEGKDNIFINRLGINSLIREALSAWNSHEQGRLVHRFGGEPVGAFLQPGQRPLVPSMAHAIFFDMTHDNPSPVEKRSIHDLIPSSALVNMACCASGSNRGYDELVPHHIHVVSESRTYQKLEDIDVGKTIIPVKKALNDLHKYLGANGFKEVYVDQMDEDIVAITRHNPITHESIVLVAHTAFSSGVDPNHVRIIKPVTVEGQLMEVVLEAKLVQQEDGQFEKDPQVINGVSNFRTDFRKNISIEESHYSRRGHSSNPLATSIDLHHFTPGSVIAFRFQPHNEQLEASKKVQAKLSTILKDNSEFAQIVAELSLLDLNYVLYRCVQEESEDGGGTYHLDGYGSLKYAGLQGVMSILSEIRHQNDLGNWLPGNLRNGNWLMDYISGRLIKMPSTKRLGEWYNNVFQDMHKIQRYLIPRYFDAVVSTTYIILLRRAWSQMSPFVTNGSNFLRALALGSVSHTAVVRSAPLPALSPNLADPKPFMMGDLAMAPTMAAGLPHFSTGYMRSWGRDTFIALRGFLILTGRYQEARYIILGYGACLRHGLIPNLLDGGKNARFNCRDAVWWWLYCIVSYVNEAPEGHKILKDKVSRLFPTDEADLSPPGAYEQNLEEVIHEALLRHFQGLKFRERNAGTRIDEHMLDMGFNNEIGVDMNTGFVFGGNVHNCGTWMDKMGSSAKAGIKGKPATPRDGSAVEIVGLCYASLVGLSKLYEQGQYPFNSVEKCNQDGSKITLSLVEWAQKIKTNFETFYHVRRDDPNDKHPEMVNKTDIYKDTLNSGLPWTDYQLRCNFSITMAVAPELFDPQRAWNALQIVKAKLLGPLGIKTLDPDDWSYRGDYDNSDDSSDCTLAHGFNYHQGPEWVWPVGFFLRAYLIFARKVQKLDEGRNFVMSVLSAHYIEVQNSHWRGIPELTNHDGTLCPGSNPIQAWSMSCLLEVLYDLEKL